MNSTSQLLIRSALQGQTLLVVGGERRDGALTRLHAALGLAKVVHCPTRKSDASPRCFESRIRESGVVLVVWVLGLSRTHHGEHLHRRCRELAIPWVDVFRIPHPNALLARLEELRLADALGRRHHLNLAAAPPRFRQIGGAA